MNTPPEIHENSFHHMKLYIAAFLFGETVIKVKVVDAKVILKVWGTFCVSLW